MRYFHVLLFNCGLIQGIVRQISRPSLAINFKPISGYACSQKANEVQMKSRFDTRSFRKSASKLNGVPDLLTSIAPDTFYNTIVTASLELLASLPPGIRVLLRPRELLAYLLFRFSYSRALRFSYGTQRFVSRFFGRSQVDENGRPKSYLHSILGFLEPRFAQLSYVTGLIYILNVCLSALGLIGVNMRPVK